MEAKCSHSRLLEDKTLIGLARGSVQQILVGIITS